MKEILLTEKEMVFLVLLYFHGLKLFFTLISLWLMITICFKFWNFTMTLFYLLGFTKELVFGSSTSVTRLNVFLKCYRWFSLF